MQKWIGVGRIDEEPTPVKISNADALLMWVRCTRAWDARKDDAVPVLFLGKRRFLVLKQAKAKGTLAGVLVYVTGEISSRVKIQTDKEINFGAAVFASSITFWDSESIENVKNKATTEESLMSSSLEDL